MILPGAAPHGGVRVRQLAWFVLAMVAPSLVVVGLGIRMLFEQEELAQKHLADERRLQANDVERALITMLDTLRRHPNDATVILGHLSSGRIVLPWEGVPHTSPAPALLDVIAAAEREEFGSAGAAAAETRLRGRLRRFHDASEDSFLRLPLARVLAKQGKNAQAAAQDRMLLNSGLDAVDANGTPLAWYGAERLTSETVPSDADVTAIGASLNTALARRPPLPPAAWYQAHAIVDRLKALPARAARFDTITVAIEGAIADTEEALAVQRDEASLVGHWRVSDNRWLPHGQPARLIGLAPATPTGERPLVAVRADAVAEAVAERFGGGPVLLTSAGATGEALGERFPGLRVIVPAPVDPSSPSRLLYVAGLVIILSVTLFGAWLLLRDVQRDVRLTELRSQFVSSVSHELKTPLTAIRMFAETLQSNRVDPAMRADYLDTIVNESERLTRLINNVLDFSKIEQGAKAYRRERTSLPIIVRTAVRAMSYPMAQQGFAMSVDADDTVPPTNVDGDAIEQAVLNLLTNAMKYSGEARDIEVRLTQDGTDAVISVRDRGIGIAAGDQRHIFEKFYRVPSSDNERIPGAGLGLTIVDHIVRAHGGRVTVESTPGAGSRFSIRLPIKATLTPITTEAAS